MRKSAPALLFIFLVTLPSAMAVSDSFSARDWFSQFFTLSGDASSIGKCLDGGDNDISIDIDSWQQDPNHATKAYIYLHHLEPESTSSHTVSIVPYKSHRGRIAWGGLRFDTAIVSTSPLSQSDVQKCIPSYVSSVPEVSFSGPSLSACGGADLRITSVSFNRADIKPGVALGIVVAVQNVGRSTVAQENIECGIYPSSSNYIRNVFPKRINPLSLISRGASNCVDGQNYVQTVEVLELAPGETKLQSFAPIVPNEEGEYTVICGIYPTGRCGSYVNSCGKSDKKDVRT